MPVYLSDNAFWLDKGESRTISVRHDIPEDIIIKGINFDKVICSING